MPESNDRGALTEAVYYILLSLFTPLHGYGIMQNVAAISGGRVALGPGTLYGALNTLAQKGWIVGVGPGGGRVKEYVITETGRQVVADEVVRLAELLENGLEMLGGGKQDDHTQNILGQGRGRKVAE